MKCKVNEAFCLDHFGLGKFGALVLEAILSLGNLPALVLGAILVLGKLPAMCMEPSLLWESFLQSAGRHYCPGKACRTSA